MCDIIRIHPTHLFFSQTFPYFKWLLLLIQYGKVKSDLTCTNTNYNIVNGKFDLQRTLRLHANLKVHIRQRSISSVTGGMLLQYRSVKKKTGFKFRKVLM